jgi:pimeloyl-ACP methyl ester carboxylesterase
VESPETSFNNTAAPARLSSPGKPSELPAACCLLPPCPPYRIEGSGPLLVYISGLDGTGELFFKQAPQLAQSFRVATFRQRDDGDFSYEDLADDVAAIIRDAGEPRATLIAESFGGGVALTFAVRYPQMVEHLILVNSFPRYRERLRIRLAAWGASWVPFKAIWPLRCAASLLGLYLDGVRGADRRRFFQAVRKVSGKAYGRRLRLIAELDLDDRLSEISAPTLLVATKKDMLVRSIREARFMAERLPSAKVKIITDAGHACLLGDAVRLADLLIEWTNGKEEEKGRGGERAKGRGGEGKQE